MKLARKLDKLLPLKKTCSQCGETKSSKEFYRNWRCADTLYPNCKVCHVANTTRYDQENPEQLRDRQRKYQAKARKIQARIDGLK